MVGKSLMVKYGEALETINDGEYAICEKALNHFLPELNKFITSGWRFGDPDDGAAKRVG
jgi:hypothetical protein